MRVTAAVICIAGALLRAGPAAAQVSVGVLDVSLGGELSADLRGPVEEALIAGLEARGLHVVGNRALADALGVGHTDLSECTSASCLDDLAERAGVDAVVRIAVRGALNVYSLRLEALGLDGERLAGVDGGCDICNHAELARAVDEAARLLADDVPRTAAVMISVSPDDARITVDGERVAAGEVSLAPGARIVEASAEGYAATSYVLEVRLGGHAEVHLELQRDIFGSRRAGGPDPRAMTIAGWVLVAVGAGTLAAGLVDIGIDGLCAGGDRDEDGDCADIYTTLWPGVGLAIGGGAVAVTGVILLLLGRRAAGRSAGAPRAWLSPGPLGSTGLGAGFLF